MLVRPRLHLFVTVRHYGTDERRSAGPDPNIDSVTNLASSVFSPRGRSITYLGDYGFARLRISAGRRVGCLAGAPGSRGHRPSGLPSIFPRHPGRLETPRRYCAVRSAVSSA